MATYQRFKNISPPTIIPNQIIFHSACDNYGVEGHLSWQLNGTLESHAYTARNGDIYEIVPYNKRAQANYTANGPRGDGTGAISMETGSDIPALDPWTNAQLDAMVDWARRLLSRFPTIGRRKCPNAGASGIGYHVMFGAPGPWAPRAKTCPGPERIKQFNSILLPRIIADAPVVIPVDPPKDWFDMATKDDLKAAVREVIDERDLVNEGDLVNLARAVKQDIYDQVLAALINEGYDKVVERTWNRQIFSKAANTDEPAWRTLQAVNEALYPVNEQPEPDPKG